MTGRDTEWNMVRYDVQLMGGIQLHLGKIAEMAIYLSTEPSATGSSNDVVIGIKKLDIGDFAPLFIKTPKVNGFMSGNIRINDPFGKPAVEFDTKTEEFRFENDSIGEYLLQANIFQGLEV